MTTKSDLEASKAEVAALRAELYAIHAMIIHKVNLDAATAEERSFLAIPKLVANTAVAAIGGAPALVVGMASALWTKVRSVKLPRVSVEW